MKNENGFTLVEVLASIAIMTILLLSFSHIFISNNKYAAVNTEKLVVVNLADAQLERIRATGKKVKPEDVFRNIEMNGKTYKVTVRFNQTEEEEKMNIQNIIVQVRPMLEGETEEEAEDEGKKNLGTTVEGYVVYEEVE